MRLREVTVRNYRIHRDLQVTLDPHRNVIAGPNESGKSTLMEAIHRGLFLKASGNRKEHREMLSTTHGGSPEIELCFEANQKTYRLKKESLGRSGKTQLTEVGGTTWHGAEAEERLREIIKEDGEKFDSTWDHIFVQQGRSGENPTVHANAYRDDLVARFQQAGGAVIQQSEKDAAVAAEIATEIDVIYTKAGEAKRGSELGKATSALEAAREALDAAQRRYEQREAAINSWRSATETIERCQADRTPLCTEQEEIRERARKIEVLKRDLADADREHKEIANRHQALIVQCKAIDDTRRELVDAIAARQPLIAAIEIAAGQAKAAKLALDRAEQAVVACEEEASNAIARWRLVEAWRDRAQAARDRDDYGAKRDRIDKLKAKLAEHREALARLPKIAQEQIGGLEDLVRRVDEAETTIRAIAASVRVVAADRPLRIGDRALEPGDSYTFTDVAELVVGDGVRVEITPGGGRSVADARRQRDDVRRAHARYLEQLGVASDVEARSVLREREGHDSVIAGLNAQMEEEEGGNALDAALAECAERLTATQSQIDQLRVKFSEEHEPETLAEAQRAVDAAAAARDRADTSAQAARQQRDEAVAALAVATAAEEKNQSKAAEAQRAVDRLESSLDTLVRQFGDDNARANAVAEIVADLDRRASMVQSISAELAKLQPELIEQDRNRVERALDKLDEKLRKAQSERDQAAGALRGDGSADLEGDLASARAEVARAEQRYNRERLRGEALKRLRELFAEQQEQLAVQYTQPLVDRANQYLKPVLGADVELKLTLDGTSVKALGIYRQSVSTGAFEFDVLSGGTREQVAAALRLAIAEVLAADHDGCLPVVFDDAFTHSDPERTRALQRMLDLAATRGLQVIVLTCDPSAYTGFGAHEIHLPAAVERGQT